MPELIKTMYLENCIARIHMPELTEEQKKTRMDRIRKATEKFLCEVESGKRHAIDKSA